MATEETWTPSRRLQSAATAEQTRIERERQRLTARERQLREELAATTARQRELQAEMDVLRRFSVGASSEAESQDQARRLRVVGPNDPTDEGPGTVVLKGAQIRERAVAVLAASDAADQAVHYRTWFELLAQRGYVPAGKDPVATFLTQIGRSPVVKRSTSAGVYALDLGFVDRAQQRLAQLREELASIAITDGDASVADLHRLRDHRETVQAKIDATQRALDEAVRSLGAEAPARNLSN